MCEFVVHPFNIRILRCVVHTDHAVWGTVLGVRRPEELVILWIHFTVSSHAALRLLTLQGLMIGRTLAEPPLFSQAG